MGLFTRQEVKVPTITKTEYTRECPMCGKEHTVEVCTWAPCYLDGTPMMTLEQYYSRFVICDECHYIFDAKTCCGPLSDYAHQRFPLVREAAMQTYENDILKKQAMLNTLYGNPEVSWVNVRYHQERGQDDAANDIMRQIIANNAEFTQVMGNDSLQYMSLPGQTFYTQDWQKLDYLRQLGLFTDANNFCKKLHQRAIQENDDSLLSFVQTESKLIRKKDSTHR